MIFSTICRSKKLSVIKSTKLALVTLVSLGWACGATAYNATVSTTDPEPSEEAAKELANYKRTGETVRCLGVRQIRTLTPLDERHFLARVGPNQYYLNITGNRCFGANRISNRVQYTTSIARLCRNEIITIIDNSTGIVSGTCGLGDFEKLEKIEKPAEE